MHDIDAMKVFARVAERGSFTRAAADLGLPKASVSIAVQQLETLLGTRLLHRTTRRVEPTQDGLAFLERCRDMLDDIDELQSMFRDDERDLRGRLRVDMPTTSARLFVLPQLPDFLAAHPGIELELSCADRRVDLIHEGFDCVLRVGALENVDNLVARPLGQLVIGTFASPGYLARHGEPHSPDDLGGHRMVHYAQSFGGQPDGFEYVDADGVQVRPVAGALTVNNTESYQAACVAGLGLIQAPTAGLQPLVDAGQLREVLRDYRAAPMPMNLLYAHRRHLPRRVRVFMEWLAGRLAPILV
ncbi:LysR family transcriptional regulator [Rhodanobacter sp. KK11]|uniref:LysR family transcriptional regulator n=1 Tax=Rhodanobacter sp. KK11 TaxID=3083255 RepID=UPI0029669395|nr:LysR family transcriptional regulator [Rhodanobacter sp. KK11]MDW2981562.1 LysR family transcriptional regulator [Rhodanobacter sp. KK11]